MHQSTKQKIRKNSNLTLLLVLYSHKLDFGRMVPYNIQLYGIERNAKGYWNLKFWNLKFENLKFENLKFEIWHLKDVLQGIKRTVSLIRERDQSPKKHCTTIVENSNLFFVVVILQIGRWNLTTSFY